MLFPLDGALYRLYRSDKLEPLKLRESKLSEFAEFIFLGELDDDRGAEDGRGRRRRRFPRPVPPTSPLPRYDAEAEEEAEVADTDRSRR